MQQVIVIVLVAAAALVAVWQLMPARRRLQLLVRADAALARRGWLTAWRRGALARRIQAAAGPGCSGCAANTTPHPRAPHGPR